MTVVQLAPLAVVALGPLLAILVSRVQSRRTASWIAGFWIVTTVVYLPMRVALLSLEGALARPATSSVAFTGLTVLCGVVGVLLVLARMIFNWRVIAARIPTTFDSERAHGLVAGLTTGTVVLAGYVWLIPLVTWLSMRP